jgi:hypothetical protein
MARREDRVRGARRRSSARAMSTTTTTTRGARALANLFARCAAQASSACVAGPTTTTAGAVARGGAIASARAFDRRGARRDETRRDATATTGVGGGEGGEFTRRAVRAVRAVRTRRSSRGTTTTTTVDRSNDRSMGWYGMGSAWVTNGGNTTGDLTRGATTGDERRRGRARRLE